jgi:iron complex transport system substrate-binding protein
MSQKARYSALWRGRCLVHGRRAWHTCAVLGSDVVKVALVGALVGSSVAGAAATEAGPAQVDIVQAPAGLGDAIVSTNLPTEEILLALVPPERVLAVSVFADDPQLSNVREPAARVPHRVRPGTGDGTEHILSLDPSVVLIFPYSRPEAQALLTRSGVPVAHVPAATDLAGVRETVRHLGRLVNETARAETLVRGMDETLEAVRGRVEGATRPRVLFYNRGYVAGRGTLYDELLEAAGGVNAAREAGVVGHERLALERCLALDPEVILYTTYRADGRSREVVSAPSLSTDPIWRGVRAVREDRVYRVPERHLMSTSHHVVHAAEAIARVLHPARYEGPRP